MRRRLLALTVLVLAAGAGASWFVLRRERTPTLSRVQRGYHVAESKGCFACHGPGGIRGMADPGHGLDEVPPLAGGLVTMYSRDEGELREWILDGAPRRIREDPEQWRLRERAVIQMPAWRRLIDDQEMADLMAFVKAVSDIEKPQDERARAGKKAADRLGCFNCHGPQGRGSLPNLLSFKGVIPPWDGPDFAELAKDDSEIREWILYGGPRRLREQPAARFFLERQPIKMPAYQGHVTDEELDGLVAYIRWVGQHPY